MPIAPETVQRLTAALTQLVRAGRHITARAAARELPAYGWTLLVPLERAADQRTSELAARAGIDLSVASRQLAALERHGYVTRRPDPADGRATLFRLTPEGADALAAARALRSSWNRVARLVTDLDRATRPAHTRSPAAIR